MHIVLWSWKFIVSQVNFVSFSSMSCNTIFIALFIDNSSSKGILSRVNALPVKTNELPDQLLDMQKRPFILIHRKIYWFSTDTLWKSTIITLQLLNSHSGLFFITTLWCRILIWISKIVIFYCDFMVSNTNLALKICDNITAMEFRFNKYVFQFTRWVLKNYEL